MMLKPNARYDVQLNGQKATQVSVFDRKSQVQTMINDIHHLRHISKGGTGNRSKMSKVTLREVFRRMIYNEMHGAVTTVKTPKGGATKKKPVKKTKDQLREEAYL
jgi:hypothetical protein